MRMTMLVALAASGVLSSTGSPAARQRAFRAAIDLVQVDVMVLDAAGRPVRGLQKSDFALLDQGNERDIDVFVEVDAAPATDAYARSSARRDVVSNADARTDRLVVVVLDDLHVRRDHTDRARAAARRLVEQLSGRATMAVVLTSGDPGVEFTDDPAEVLAAIDRFEGRENNSERRGDPWLIRRFNPGAGASGPTDLKAVADRDRLLTTLTDAANRLPRRDGRRKALVLVSEGARMGTLSDPSAGGMPDSLQSYAEFPASGMYSSAAVLVGPEAKLVDAIRASGVSIYAIDPRGTTALGREGYSASIEGHSMREIDIAWQRRDSLDLLSGETGGFAVVNTDDLMAAADRVAEDVSSYYALGFSPADLRSRRVREVAIRVNRPGLSVRHRRLYRVDAGLTDAEKAGAKDPLLGLAYSPVSTGDLPMRAWAAASFEDRPRRDAALALWLDTGDVPISEYAVFVVDLDRKRDVGSPVGRKLSGAVPALLPLDAPRLRPGRYQIRIAALARNPDRGGSVYLTVTMPDVTTAPVSLSEVAIGAEISPREDRGTLPFVPTLERVFSRGSTIQVAFDVWRQSSANVVQVSIELVDRDGRPVTQWARTASAPGRSRFSLPLSLDDATPGAYSLRVSAADGQAMAEREIKLTLR